MMVLLIVASLALAGCAGEEEATEPDLPEESVEPTPQQDAGDGDAGDATTPTPTRAPPTAEPEPPAEPTPAAGDDEARVLTVTDVRAERGDCLFGSDAEQECHILDVRIDNAQGAEDFSTNMFYWSAASDAGGVYEAPEVQGADAIAAGSSGQITLRFDVDAGERLATLRHEPILGTQTTAPIPGYAPVGESGGAGGGGDAPTTAAGDASFAVTDATRRSGDCILESGDGTTCHVLTVAIDNTGGAEDFSANMFYWSAVSADGAVYQAPWVEGPEAVAPGGSATVTLAFDVEGEATLAELRHEPMLGAQTTAPIPAY